jgi:hypothetical protein
VNTSTVYVEPIFVGCLIGVALILPFYSDLRCFYDNHSELHIAATFLGIFVIGVAYLIGIPADRLLDSLMEGIEKHCRIRFVLKEAIKDESIRRNIRDGKDPFPQDRYRTAALLHAGPAFNDFLQYVRTRVRMTRALAFAIPSLIFAGLAYHALTDNSRLAPMSTATICLLKGGVSIAWTFAMLFVFLLQRRTVDKVVSRMRCQWPTGRWNPPRTDRSRDITKYARDRKRASAKSESDVPATIDIKGLFLDVGLQPFPVSSALLLVAAAIVGYSSSGPAGLIPAGLGALLTCTVGYAWWRSTETFMTYLLIAGRELERSASRAGLAT